MVCRMLGFLDLVSGVFGLILIVILILILIFRAERGWDLGGD
jgi:hypothetical protein